MKRILFLPLFAMMALLFSCSNDENNMPETDDRVFTGKLLLNGSLIDDDTRCELNVVEGSASITIYGVQFAPAMPAMDITMPMLDCKKSGDGYAISGTDVLPLVAGTPMTDFMVSSLEASLSGDKFVVSAETALGTIGFTNALLTPVKPAGDSKSYRGELKVDEFVKEVVVDVKEDPAAGTVDVVINDVKFAANMPLVLDIALKNIPCIAGDGVSFYAENVAPYINTETEPAPAYSFAVVDGKVNGTKLILNAHMADDLAAYVAGKVFIFEGVEVE